MAKIKTLTVTSAAKIPHPRVQYAMLEASASIEVELGAKENLNEVFEDTRIQADALVKSHLTEKFNSAQNAGGTTNG